MDTFTQASSSQNDIRIILASDGRVCLQTRPTKDFSTVKSLMVNLQTLTNIPIFQQVLLNKKGERLPENDFLNFYIGISFYLFDKSHFNSQLDDQIYFEEENALQKELEKNFENVHVIYPPHLENNSYKFIDFQKQFYDDNEQIGAIHKESTKYCTKVAIKFQEIQNQQEAIEASTANLFRHSKKLNYLVEKFHESFDSTLTKFRDLSNNFESYIEKLGKIPLHPNLVTDTMKTLRDCVKEPQLRIWLQRCLKELDAFVAHVERGKQRAYKVQSDVEAIELKNYKIDLKELEELVNNAKKLSESNKKSNQEFNEEYELYIDTFKNMKDNNPSDLEELEKRLNSSVLRRRRILEISKVNLKEIKEILTQIIEKKKQSIKIFFSILNKIASIQNWFRKLTKEYDSTFDFVKQDLRRKFAQIEIVKLLPGVYQLSCREVQRRKEFLKIYESEVEKAKEKINEICIKEMEIEKKYWKNIGKYLPPDLFPSLEKFVPECIISIKSSEYTNLPDLNNEIEINLNKEDINLLLNRDFSEQDLQFFLPIEKKEFLYDSMDILSSRMDTNTNDLFTYKNKINEQQNIIEKQLNEIKKLQNQLSQKEKEAERAESARQKHASDSEHYRNLNNTIQEELERLSKDSQSSSNIQLLLEMLKKKI